MEDLVKDLGLDNFLVEAIESDSVKEHVVPLNDYGAFINGAYFEEGIKEANIKVKVLEHLYVAEDVGEEEPNLCEDWLIEFKCDELEVKYKKVKLGEEASFSIDIKDIEGDEGVDDIIMPGIRNVELSIIAVDEGHDHTEIKISVS